MRSFFSEFPQNTTIVLSIDTFHGEALRKVGIPIADLFRITQEEAIARGLGFEINMRKGAGANPYSELESFGLPAESLIKLGKNGLIHLNTVFAQNAGKDLPSTKTIATKASDYINHMFAIEPVGLFINPQGRIVRDIHSAFMVSPPPAAVIGDLHTQSLTEALVNGLIAGYYGDRDYPRNSSESRIEEKKIAARMAAGSIPIEPESFKDVIEWLFQRTGRLIEWNKLFALIKNPESGVTWEFDLDKDKMIKAFGSEVIPYFLGQAANLVVAEIVSPDNNGKRIVLSWAFGPGPDDEIFRLIVKNGELSVDSTIHSYPFDHGFDFKETVIGCLRSMANALTKRFDRRSVNEYFLKRIAEGLEQNKNKAKQNRSIFPYWQAARERDLIDA